MSASQQFQAKGFYLSGFASLLLAVLKLTEMKQWSWWRVFLPDTTVGSVLRNETIKDVRFAESALGERCHHESVSRCRSGICCMIEGCDRN